MATIADELNAISVEHGYTGAAPKTIAGAIDALADTLAGEDVSSPRSIAGAIHALAPYIGGGGGGAALGSMQWPACPVDVVPAAEAEFTFLSFMQVLDIYTGDLHVVGYDAANDQLNSIYKVAAGSTVTYNVPFDGYSDAPDVEVFACAFEMVEDGFNYRYFYTGVRQLDVTTSVSLDAIGAVNVTLVQPELEAGEQLFIYVAPVESDDSGNVS